MDELFHTFILGVPSKYRGWSLEAQLRTFGLEYSRVAAIEPGEIPNNKIRWVRIPRFLSVIPSLSPGEVCCSFGHKKIYSLIAEGEKEWGFVLEDDAILRLNPNLVSLENLDWSSPTILQLSPDPWIHTFSSQDSLVGLAPDPTILSIKTPRLETCAYFINKKAAQLILRSAPQNVITSRADWPLEAVGQVSFMATTVFCAYQLRVGTQSQIEGRGEVGSELPRFLRILRMFSRVLGITSLVYKAQGAPFFSSYQVEVVDPLLRRRRG